MTTDVHQHLPGKLRSTFDWVRSHKALITALVAAVPTVLEGFQSQINGVPFGQSADARAQTGMWERNFPCPASATTTPILTLSRVEIASTVCPSGDVLLSGKRPEWKQPRMRWVSWNEVAPGERSTMQTLIDMLLPKAHAAPVRVDAVQAQSFGSVICQRWVGNGLLLQRVTTPQGCFDQVVNTANGWVVNRNPAPCNPSC